jgi:hypothetical protein
VVLVLTGAVYGVFSAWWLIRQGQSTPLYATGIVQTYLVAAGALAMIWAFAPMGNQQRPRVRAATGAAISTAMLAGLALAALSHPQAAMLSACSPPVRCEDFSGALLAYGWWIVSLIAAGFASLLYRTS